MKGQSQRCIICISDHAKAITDDMIAGMAHKAIIAKYPDVKLYPMALSRHRRHFSLPLDLARAEGLTDHGFVDLLRRVAGAYLLKADAGHELTLIQARLVTTASNAISQRYQIQDSAKQTQSLEALLKQASTAQWKGDAV